MTLDEVIKHCEEVAEEQDMKAGFETDYHTYTMSETERERCRECANEHRQLAEWLKELKQLREQTKLISVSERLPQKGEQVLVASKHFGMVVAEFDCVKYNDIEEKFFLTHYSIASDEMAVIEVEYWMPLPEPYKTESEEEE